MLTVGKCGGSWDVWWGKPIGAVLLCGGRVCGVRRLSPIFPAYAFKVRFRFRQSAVFRHPFTCLTTEAPLESRNFPCANAVKFAYNSSEEKTHHSLREKCDSIYALA
jgi:hypothetical protein